MKKTWKYWIAWTACLGMLNPLAVFGEGTPANQEAALTIRDVSLQDGNRLAGKLVDAQGRGLSDTSVAIIHDGQLAARSMTDADGYFQANGLRGGVYQISAGRTASVYRLWASNTAPPSASHGVLLVDEQSAVLRGQCPDGCNPGGYVEGDVNGGYAAAPCDTGCYGGCPPAAGGGGLLGVLANPWVIGAVVAAAIAIPLALDDDDAS